MIHRFFSAVRNTNEAFGSLSGLCIAAAALLIIVEIASRLVLEQSLQITEEYTGYLMAVSSMMGLGYVEKHHGHIRMDLIYLLQAKYPGLIRSFRIFAYGMGATFACYLTYVGWRLFYQSYLYGSKSMQISETPLVIPQLFIPLGAAALCLQYLCNLYSYCIEQSSN